jgi:hypothetical protein
MPHEITTGKLADAWRVLLERYLWTHYCTLTYDSAVPLDRWRRDFTNTFIRRLARFSQQPVPWFFVIQSSGGADRPHIHALIAGTQALSGRQLAATWRFGYTRVVRYDPSRSACGYVSREILESSDDHDLSARLPTLLSTCPTAELRPRMRLMLPAA